MNAGVELSEPALGYSSSISVISEVYAAVDEAHQLVGAEPLQVVGEPVGHAVVGQPRHVNGIAPCREHPGEGFKLGGAVGEAVKEDGHALGAAARLQQAARAGQVERWVGQLGVDLGLARGDTASQ